MWFSVRWCGCVCELVWIGAGWSGLVRVALVFSVGLCGCMLVGAGWCWLVRVAVG